MNKIMLIVFILVIFSCGRSNGTEHSNQNDDEREFEIYKTQAKNGLILRKLPKKNSEKVTTIKFNQFLKVFKNQNSKTESIDGISGQWLEADYLGMTGYVFSGYISQLNKAEIQLFSNTIEKLLKEANSLERSKPLEAEAIYYFIYRRSYFESNSPYCLSDECTQACSKYIELKDCKNNPTKSQVQDREIFLNDLKSAVRDKDKNKLLSLSNKCLMGVPICFNCDGGGISTINSKHDQLFENYDKIDFNTINLSTNILTIEATKPYNSKAIEYGNDKALPFVEIHFKKFGNSYLIETLDGEATYSSEQCIFGA